MVGSEIRGRIVIRNRKAERSFSIVEALAGVARERTRQDKKWGEQNHSPVEWLAILMEEVGELAEAVLHHNFNTATQYHQGDLSHGTGAIEDEANQVAAVAVAMVESLRRQGVLK